MQISEVSLKETIMVTLVYFRISTTVVDSTPFFDFCFSLKS